MYEHQLQQLGLTAGESRVYEALLIVGPSTIGPILKKSGVAYSKIYHILNRLIDKGLVSFILREKTKYFNAVEPARIRDYLEKQEEQVRRNKAALKKLLPGLEKLILFAGKKEEARIFVGEKGLMSAYENLLKETDKKDEGVFFYVHDPIYYGRAEKFYVKSWQVVKKFGNRWRGVANYKFKKTRLAKKYPPFIEQRYASFPLPSNIEIIKAKVLITAWRDKPIGILIESLEIAENFKRYFETVWKMSKS